MQGKTMRTIFKLTILILLLLPFSCQAVFWEDWFENQAGTEVINEIKVETNTGGNVIQGGDSDQTIEGEAKSKIEVKTIIDGEEVESISTESDEGSIEVRQEIVVEKNEEPVVETIIEARVTPVKKLWFGFMTNLKTLFKKFINIFK